MLMNSKKQTRGCTKSIDCAGLFPLQDFLMLNITVIANDFNRAGAQLVRREETLSEAEMYPCNQLIFFFFF